MCLPDLGLGSMPDHRYLPEAIEAVRKVTGSGKALMLVLALDLRSNGPTLKDL